LGDILSSPAALGFALLSWDGISDEFYSKAYAWHGLTSAKILMEMKWASVRKQRDSTLFYSRVLAAWLTLTASMNRRVVLRSSQARLATLSQAVPRTAW
jgi:hypothetical protein